MAVVSCSSKDTQANEEESKNFTTVKRLAELNVERLPSKYILPPTERPNAQQICSEQYNLPVIDISGLEGPERAQVVRAIGRACQERGFFQVVNHGVPASLISDTMGVASQFFELPFEERKKYMSGDMMTPVRYGTSFNHLKDRVLCWRDFLKHYCYPISKMVHFWPSNPPDYRRVVSSYSEEVRALAVRLMGAVVESLGLPPIYVENMFKDGSQIMVLNCYPACPEPELTLGMPAHSDYGCITILLQDAVGGLQVQHEGQWRAVRPLPHSFIVNLGDHLEILSNGLYKSVMHRVVVNSERSRVSVATLHSLPFEANIKPAQELIDEQHPQMYRETNFGEFLKLIASNEFKAKGFLNSLRLIPNSN